MENDSNSTYCEKCGCRITAGRCEHGVMPPQNKNLNGYVCIYKGKRKEVYAETSLAAQKEAAKQFGAKKSFEVSVTLAEKNDEQVTHIVSN